MPFIGQQPVTGAYHKLDSITTSATATYNLLLNGGAYSPASANHLLVSLNGVMQAPQDSFTVSGSTITFASALTSSDNIDFIMALGDVLNIGTPSDGTVTAGKIASDAVTTAKIADNNVTVAKLPTTMDLSSNTVTLNKNASSLVHLARIDASPSASTYEWSMNYTDYTHFRIIVERITGSSASGSENLDVKFKFDGTLDNGSATPYNLDMGMYGSSTVRGANNTDNCEWMHTNNPSYHWNGIVDCYNFGPNDSYAMMNSVFTGITSNGQQAYAATSGTDQSVGARITAMRIAFTAGNVNTVKLDIYGVKS